MDSYFNQIELFILDYGYPLVFFILLIESSFILSLFVPGTLVLFLAGYFCAEGIFKPEILFLVAFSAVTIGDMGSFALGRYVSKSGTKNTIFLKFIEKKDELSSVSNKYFLFYHFASYARLIFPFLYGSIGYNFKSWALLNSISVFLFCLVSILFGMGSAIIFASAYVESPLRHIYGFFFVLFIPWVFSLLKLFNMHKKYD